MIDVYAVKVQAYDEDEQKFKLETFDENCAKLEITTLVTPGKSLEELFDAIRKGFAMLGLKEDNHE